MFMMYEMMSTASRTTRKMKLAHLKNYISVWSRLVLIAFLMTSVYLSSSNLTLPKS